MTRPAQITLTLLAMLAFAANSLLGRLALRDGAIDAASYTTIRIASGALMLWLILLLSRRRRRLQGNWPAALSLFVYGGAFSYAYLSLSAATGALLLFAAVQVTMICSGLMCGERLSGLRLSGFILAAGGLLALLLPGLERPPLLGAGLMLLAGAAWGVYSIRGRGAADPVAVTGGNFALAVLPSLLLLALPLMPQGIVYSTPGSTPIAPPGLAWALPTAAGLVYALLSGALASGLGYVLWYAVLPRLRATEAAAVQLSVPVLAAAGGILLLGEPASLRLLLCGIATLGGIALVLLGPQSDTLSAQAKL